MIKEKTAHRRLVQAQSKIHRGLTGSCHPEYESRPILKHNIPDRAKVEYIVSTLVISESTQRIEVRP